MKQFSLEEYLKDPSKKVVTRDGQSVKIHCTNFDSISGQLIVAEIEGSGYSTTFFKNGKFFKSEETPLDLFFASKTKKGWINIFVIWDGTISPVGTIFPTKEEAEKRAKKEIILNTGQYVDTVKVEWEE